MRIDQLTFPRFLAATSIVMIHFFPFPANPYFPIRYLAEFVNFFFILSGFILIISSSKKGEINIEKRSYYINRFARIYPVYFFAMIGTLIFPHLVGINSSYDPLSFVVDGLLLQSWLPNFIMKHNGPSWSLSVEMFFYVTFPFLAAALTKWSSKALIILGVTVYLASQAFKVAALAYLSQLTQTEHVHHLYLAALHIPFFRYHTFLVGAITGILFLRHQAWLLKNYNKILAVFLVLLTITTIAVLQRSVYTMYYFYNGIFDDLFVLMILLLALNKGTLASIFSKKPLQYLGEISYSVYILQFPFSYLILGVLQKYFHFNEYATFFILLLGIVIGSSITYQFIEHPARNYIKKKLGSRRHLEA